MTCIFIVYKFINKELKTKRKKEGKRKKSTEKEGVFKRKKRNYKIPVGLFSLLLRGDLLGYLSTVAATCYFTESLKCALYEN